MLIELAQSHTASLTVKAGSKLAFEYIITASLRQLKSRFFHCSSVILKNPVLPILQY